MTELKVDLGQASYPILIESGVFADSKKIRQLLDTHCPVSGKTIIVTNAQVWQLFGESFTQALAETPHQLIEVANTEHAKSITAYQRIIASMLENRCTRDSRIIALGGGVVGDVAGFVAATYMRGIAIVQIPTTLLAQVDSSVGGKTAINHELAKNCIGAIKQPRLVLCDPQCLRHLDDRQLRAGLAEIIKYALIDNEEFCEWLENNIDALNRRDEQALAYAIEVSCRTKAVFVAADPFDTTGKRALLNLGHTFGHALEKIGLYDQWLHGEAVACGMLMAAQFSSKYARFDADQVARIARLLERANLPTRCPGVDAQEMLNAMHLDKKNVGGSIRLILLERIGKAYLDKVPLDSLQDFLHQFIAQSR